MQAEYGSPTTRNLYRLATHLALVAGALIFSMPFLWMATTSVKEDDEQMTEDLVWIPRLPPYQPGSPFLDAREDADLIQPQELTRERWEKLKPAVASALQLPLKAAELDRGSSSEADAVGLLEAALWRDLIKRIPSAKFDDDAALTAEIARLATPEQVAKSHRRIYRALAIGEVSLRAEGESQVRTPARASNKPDGDLLWQPTAGTSARFHQITYDKKVDEELRYDFSSVADRAVISAIVPFESKIPLKAISISLKSDASWNRLWFAIELNGERYEAIEPHLLGGTGKRYSEVFYQLPTPDDENDLKIRHWNITKKAAAAPSCHSQPGSVKIELAVENTSTFRKACDKAAYNYKQSLRFIPFWRYLLTSLFLVAMNVTLAIFSSSLVAYSFARLNWPGREICWAVLLATVMIPGQVTMIPHFLIMKWLGWYGTLKPLWIGHAFGSVFFIFMLRQFMKNIPKDLEDAAKIDGCSYWQIYWHVILPLVKPTCAAIGIFTFMGTWNDFMGPLMYVADQKYYPLSLGLFAFQVTQGTAPNQGMMMAASLMMTLPVIALFFFAQKQFIQGVTFTGIKG